VHIGNASYAARRLLIATALVAAVGNAREFKSGRELSAWLDLVPRQHSSEGSYPAGISGVFGRRFVSALYRHTLRIGADLTRPVRRVELALIFRQDLRLIVCIHWLGR
jgi:hypothetical protein